MEMEKHVMTSQEGFGSRFKLRSFLLSGNKAEPCCGQIVFNVF